MTAVELLQEVESRGGHLEIPAPGRLRFTPKGAASPELVSALRARKVELLRLLEQRGSNDMTADWRKATEVERCEHCRELEARGVRVLACGTCDQRLEGSP